MVSAFAGFFDFFGPEVINAGSASSRMAPDATLLVEEFQYPTGQLTDLAGGANVSAGNWVDFSGTGNPIMVNAGSLSYPDYPSSGIGNKIRIIASTASSEDAYRSFDSQTSGATYAALIVNVTDTNLLPLNSSTTGEYITGFLPGTSTSAFASRISFRQGTAPNTFQIGLRASGNAGNTAEFSTVDRPAGIPVLIVFSYEIVSGTANDVTKMWINPSLGGSEPSPTVTQVAAAEIAEVSRIFVRQGTSGGVATPNADLDGIRVGTSWAEVTGTAGVPTDCLTVTQLSGAQEVPPTASIGSGVGTVSLSSDETTLFVDLSFTGLGSNATAAHIHGPAPAGANAGVVFGLTGVPSATSGSIPTQSFAITPTQVAHFKQGLFYFNIHTSNLPDGEIRGQIIPTCGPTAVQFSSSTFAGSESNSAAITVTRTGDASGTSTVTFSTVSGGTATGGGACGSGADYVTTSQTVTFTAGETSKTVNVTLCADAAAESSETVNLELTDPAGTALGAQSTAVLSIRDVASQFRNDTPITVTAGAAGSPYPSTINVTGATTTVFRIRVTLYDFTPTPGDHVDVLLVGPNGAKYILMSHVGAPTGINPPSPVTLTFIDGGTTVLPNSAPLTSGTFLPTSCDTNESFPAPAPAAPYIEPGCDVERSASETMYGAFSGQNGNGLWSLYVRDDEAPGAAVVATIAGGWGIELLAATSSDAAVSGRVVTQDGGGLRGARVTMVDTNGATRSVITSSLGYYRFDEIETGETYIISVSSRRFRFSPIVVTVHDSLADVDFVGIE